MQCTKLKLPNGATAIVCGSRPRRHSCIECDSTGTYQCDWKIGAGRTCDKYICGRHAKEVAPDNHLCPPHQRAYDEWLKAKKAKHDTNP